MEGWDEENAKMNDACNGDVAMAGDGVAALVMVVIGSADGNGDKDGGRVIGNGERWVGKRNGDGGQVMVMVVGAGGWG